MKTLGKRSVFLWTLAGLLFFIIAGGVLEHSPHFSAMLDRFREQTVPMGIFDYGALGSLLKDLSVIHVIPGDEPSRIIQQSALMQVKLHTRGEGKIQVYWAGDDRSYSESRSYIVLTRPEQEIYYFILSGLNAIRWLRIDPSDRPSEMTLKGIRIEQAGYETIRMEDEKSLKKIAPKNGILKMESGPEGILLRTSGDDSQLEMPVEAAKSAVVEKRYISEPLFPRKRGVSEYAYAANPGGTAAFPSSTIVTKEYLLKKVPTLSVAIDKDALDHENWGIAHNWWQRGQRWERLAYVSYFENGALQFSSSAGLRLQGSSTRHLRESFRLCFRRKYGFRETAPGVLFDSGKTPVKKIVLEADRANHGFNNLLAFDIARKIGCITPEIRPVIFLLNGKPPSDSAYFAAEHLDKQQWEYRLRHRDFSFVRLNNTNNAVEDQQRYDRLEERFKKMEKLSWEEVNRWIDIENFSRFIIATVFLGNWDNEQGAALLDHRETKPKWSWILWDLDVSFIDYPGWGFPGELWQQRGFPLTFQPFFRMELFKRLMTESPEYHRYFLRLFTDMLNHGINASWLDSRVDHYEALSREMFGQVPYFNGKTVREFFKKRPGHLRNELEQFYGQPNPVGKSLKCSVTGPSGVEFVIDGYPEKAGYQGWYFEGQQVDIRLETPNEENFSHWIVNGEKRHGISLALGIQTETFVEAVFFDGVHAALDTERGLKT